MHDVRHPAEPRAPGRAPTLPDRLGPGARDRARDGPRRGNVRRACDCLHSGQVPYSRHVWHGVPQSPAPEENP
ncbi:hypothetical protein RAJCM14343_5653 [Rhodococcus aetherivorans]|uniref:Uncharacterized protein n=1 Tax=Rhodococcus aetherivorans TaxID=191292 RepID=A0ABQ0YVG7_9NOCA|nr:hypothetical protein RAJCM14343_5653 [Rhodococcus aetherivorans]CCW11477.1 hypothetical protein EBESD8_20150 [Rhodococcus aetherivorans]